MRKVLHPYAPTCLPSFPWSVVRPLTGQLAPRRSLYGPPCMSCRPPLTITSAPAPRQDPCSPPHLHVTWTGPTLCQIALPTSPFSHCSIEAKLSASGSPMKVRTLCRSPPYYLSSPSSLGLATIAPMHVPSPASPFSQLPTCLSHVPSLLASYSLHLQLAVTLQPPTMSPHPVPASLHDSSH